MPGSVEAYEEVPYPGFAFPQTRVDRLHSVARLFALNPAAVTACRVLEVGCADGTNLLSMAAMRPTSEFVGIDASARAIAAAEGLTQRAGISNARFLRQDIEHASSGIGQFDYIIAHGVYSWVGPATRAALLALCRDHLAPNGVVYISYNVYPGSYLHDMAREVLELHVGATERAKQRVDSARWLAQLIMAANVDTTHARALREQMATLLERPEAAVFHDDLAAVNTPVYFHEFIAHARDHGLQFLSESDLLEGQLTALPLRARELFDQLPLEAIVREQYLDFLKNRTFRQTLLCHERAAINRDPAADHLVDLAIASPLAPGSGDPSLSVDTSERFETPEGQSVQTSHPLAKAALIELAQVWPEALNYDELSARVMARLPQAHEEAELAPLLLQLCLNGMAEPWAEPPPVSARPAGRPRTSELARAQLDGGLSTVTTLVHTNVTLEDSAARALVALLDGSHDRASLAAATGTKVDALDASVGRLAQLGLLCA